MNIKDFEEMFRTYEEVRDKDGEFLRKDESLLFKK